MRSAVPPAPAGAMPVPPAFSRGASVRPPRAADLLRRIGLLSPQAGLGGDARGAIDAVADC